MPSADIDPRRVVGVRDEIVQNVTSTDFPGHWPGEDHSWNLKHFERTMQIKFYKNNPLHAEFDLVHVDASIANAFRRILLAEVPTLAIETVYISNNTSLIQDEVLSHRLGLVPLKGAKDGLRAMGWYQKGEPPTDKDTVVLSLNIACERNPKASKTETDPAKLYINPNVYASHIQFNPIGLQTTLFAPPGEIRAANPDILLAKLRPGQEIDLEMHCVKGIGKDHAKFSPVATASYRLLPLITIKKPIVGEDARFFQQCFPKGVIGLEKDAETGLEKAVVEDARRDTVSREVLRHERFKGKVELGRVRDHFIYSIESSGQFDSDELFIQAVKILKLKCLRLHKKCEGLTKTAPPPPPPSAGGDAMEE
ncbi:putative DNA-directed RNA polymerase I and III subunit Rpc40 [Peziza echinospora]|nr:putative DNA-directed RNA polymerase I and III subunit Rpc40 [Peziza echinospora]